MSYVVPGFLPDTSTMGSMLVIRKAFTAGGGGSADDVIIFNSNAPFNFRILDSRFYISTTVALATVRLRDATGGGGNAVSDAIAASATGSLFNALKTGTDTISSGGSLVLRRSDSAVAGEVVVYIQRT